jgi:hypothetical protein
MNILPRKDEGIAHTCSLGVRVILHLLDLYTSYFLVLGILALARPKSFLDGQSLNGGDTLEKVFGQGQKNSSHCAHIVYWECEITKCNLVITRVFRQPICMFMFLHTILELLWNMKGII